MRGWRAELDGENEDDDTDHSSDTDASCLDLIAVEAAQYWHGYDRDDDRKDGRLREEHEGEFNDGGCTNGEQH